MAAPPPLVIMGAAGAGKSTVGALVARRLGARFVDADDLHPPANRAKMARGEALDDADRAPWLAALHDVLLQSATAGRSVVLACSALKATYRAVLLAGVADARLVYLRADRAVLAARLAARRPHFFPPALLDSQLAALEEPSEALVIDAARPVEDVVAQVVAFAGAA
jgi:gluconokinase